MIVQTAVGLFHRLSKSAASQRLARDDVRAVLSYSEESDDSLIGEHSPFVKHTRSKRYSGSIIVKIKF